MDELNPTLLTNSQSGLPSLLLLRPCDEGKMRRVTRVGGGRSLMMDRGLGSSRIMGKRYSKSFPPTTLFCVFFILISNGKQPGGENYDEWFS